MSRCYPVILAAMLAALPAASVADTDKDVQLARRAASDLQAELRHKCATHVTQQDLIKHSPVFRRLLAYLVLDIEGQGEHHYRRALSAIDCPSASPAQPQLSGGLQSQ